MTIIHLAQNTALLCVESDVLLVLCPFLLFCFYIILYIHVSLNYCHQIKEDTPAISNGHAVDYVEAENRKHYKSNDAEDEVEKLDLNELDQQVELLSNYYIYW